VSDEQLAIVPGKVKRPKAPVPIAEHLPVAQIRIDSPLPHLDRLFDYAVPQKMDLDAQPGVRVRIRFAGKLTDGFLIARVAHSDHQGELAPLANVISSERVLEPQIYRLCESVADRQAGLVSDVLRSAIPNRHAGAEASPITTSPAIVSPELGPWTDYVGGAALVTRTIAGESPRAAVTTGVDDPADLLARYAMTVASHDQSMIIVVPDRAAIDRVIRALAAHDCPEAGVTVVAADDGPQRRYHNWLRALRGEVRIVVGTRNAVFAPMKNLSGICIWDDWNETLSEQHAPYWTARDVAVLRSSQQECALVFIGASMSPEVAALQPWCVHIARARDDQRAQWPRVRSALDNSTAAVASQSRGSRVPELAMQAIRKALLVGPVLVLVARAGYVPRLLCGTCRDAALCSECAGPLLSSERFTAPTCQLCGHVEALWTCPRCQGHSLRAGAIGSERTGEELGRAFPGTPVRVSSSDHILRSVDNRPAIVVATAGAAPVAQDGYSAAILLDGNSMLSRIELRATEDAYEKWMECASLVRSSGDVVVVADSEHYAVQALIRNDPSGFAERELRMRQEVQLPPAVRLAVLTGVSSDIDDLLSIVDMPNEAVTRGPVPLPDGQVRLLISVERREGAKLAATLKSGNAARSAKRKGAPVNVRIDPFTL